MYRMFSSVVYNNMCYR